MDLTYSKRRHSAETIENLAQCYIENLGTLIKHCLQPDAGGYSPSDFPMARLDEEKLSKLLERVKF